MKRKYTCSLCGNKYDANYYEFACDPLITPIYDDSNLRLKIRKGTRTEIYSCNLCPKCAHDFQKLIESKIWTVCGEKWDICDFCEHHRPMKGCGWNCKFEFKKKIHAQMHQIFVTITNRLRERCLAMEDWTKYEPKFRYMMLSRMKQDCDYYLGNGNRSTNHLWAGDEKSQIENMKALWNSFSEEDKPEWLTWDELNNYAREMGVDI